MSILTEWSVFIIYIEEFLRYKEFFFLNFDIYYI